MSTARWHVSCTSGIGHTASLWRPDPDHNGPARRIARGKAFFQTFVNLVIDVAFGTIGAWIGSRGERAAMRLAPTDRGLPPMRRHGPAHVVDRVTETGG